MATTKGGSVFNQNFSFDDTPTAVDYIQSKPIPTNKVKPVVILLTPSPSSPHNLLLF